MRTKRLWVGIAGVVLLVLVSAAAARMHAGGSGYTLPAAPPPDGELAPALAKRLARLQSFAPPNSSQYRESEREGAAEQDWIQHATPGNDVPSAVLTQSRQDWLAVAARGALGVRPWQPLGPDIGLSAPNPYRDRSVYNAGTKNFSGRIAHVAIDPTCGRSGDQGACRLWIANANGGVWVTPNALSASPSWKYVSGEFEHNNTASIALDPNDGKGNTLWVGTGEPNACGSGCEAGVGLYKSTVGGLHWTGPYGKDAFNNRAVGSIAVQPGNSSVIFAASARAIRGLSNVCCGGADAIIPGAPHFGVYRSKDGGASWQLVNQGAPALCTNISPDIVSLGGTPCSPRGARRVAFDPVDPDTVYASFFARGIWRSNDLGDTWQQIMAPVGGANNNERAEFDVVELPSGATRMYVGVGGGAAPNPPPPPATLATFARVRRNDDVRTLPGAAVQAAWIDLTSSTPDTPGYSSFGYCDPQCSYDNYVFVPSAHFPNAGANPDIVYLSGANQYSENNWGPNSPRCCPDNPATGRSNGRAVLVSTDAGATFTDLTEDDADDVYPGALHPDHHALVTNPYNWKQFFDVGDGGISRSNGNFVDDSGDCAQPKGYVGAQLAFCRLVLSRVPERLANINEGLRTLHFYELNYSPHDPDTISGGTQDNGTWETVGRSATWLNVNVADGNHANYDVGDPSFRQSGWQSGQLMVSYRLQDQVDQNWIADSLLALYGGELVGFVGPVENDPVQAGWLWTAREHVFRSTNYGRNPLLTKDTHRLHCNVWFGDFGDINGDGVYDQTDFCDDWKPLGNPGTNGRLTGPGFGGDRQGGYAAAVERARSDTSTLWAATGAGRVFVSKNADDPNPASVVFRRIDNTATATSSPPRYPTAIHIDPADPNHAWITYSGFNAKTPATPGHVFEVRFDPISGNATFTSLDGTGAGAFTDIPATSIAISAGGAIYVGTDYGVLVSTTPGEWRTAGDGLPNMAVPDLVLVPERGLLYAATHGQGVWSLQVVSIENAAR